MMAKALVALSGGVDSSVTAALMKDRGYEVIGVMMKLWADADPAGEGCCSIDAAEDARRVALMLDIPFYVLNLTREFNDEVIERFVAGHAAGLTPNPCIDCNRRVRFSVLLDRARLYGCDVVATGHYARVDVSCARPRLLRARDGTKDQSYVLHTLRSEELERIRFPLGELTKSEVRKIAKSRYLRTASKPESQDLCFVPRGDTRAFLTERVARGSRPGPILDAGGARLGTHRGFVHYTVGQRRGLGVGGGVPLYVKEIRAGDNTLVVDEEARVQASVIEVSDPVFVAGDVPRRFDASVMTRYRGEEVAGEALCNGRTITVRLENPIPRPAPGQAAVFYNGEEVLGGGCISGAA